MNYQQSFGLWLKQRRKELDLTQEELAERIGCSPETVRKIEAGARRPSKYVAQLLGRFFAVPDAELDGFVAYARGDNEQAAIPTAPKSTGPTNLTPEPTPLIGRENEIAELRDLILRD